MTEVTEPAFRYGVVRPGPGLPEGFLPPHLDGRWYDLDKMPVRLMSDTGKHARDERLRERGVSISEAVAVATDRFERREDGATARVYEIRV